jgi:cytochrome c oxidase subunit 2
MTLLANSDVTREVDRAFGIIGGISTLLLVGVTVVMILFVFRYRRSKATRTQQIHGHLLLEITWIVIPTLIVMYMFFVGFRGFKLMRNAPEDAMIIEVTGQQWSWSFYYPGENIYTDKLFIPGETPVKFLLRSPVNDVIHSFYLPDFRIKEDCLPGRETYLWIKADMPQPGDRPEHHIFCAEFCGQDHSKMISTLTVLTHEEYSQWIAGRLAESNKPVEMAVVMDPESDEIKSRGGEILYKTYCLSCHGPTGKGQAETSIPNARDFTSLDNWKQGTKKTQIFRTISKGIPGTAMLSFEHLPAANRFALMHHVASFYQDGDRQVDTGEEIEALKDEFALDKPPPPRKTLPIERAMVAYIAQGNMDMSRADARWGEKLFATHCAACHQTGGEGLVGLAPSIRNRDFLALASNDFIRQTVYHGRVGTAMAPRQDLTKSDVTDIISFLREMEIANPVDWTVDPDKTIEGDPVNGKALYATYCSACHGTHGEGYNAGGSGPGIGLPGFIDVVSDDYIFQTIKHGRIGTAMMPFSGAKGLANLSDSEIGDIIAHLRNARHVDPAVASLDKWVDPGDPDKGKDVFQANCSACHQMEGHGLAGLAPSIRNRDFLAIASDEFIKSTIRGGRPGTAMLPRPDLTESEVNHILAFLRDLEVANPVTIAVDPEKTYEGDPDRGRMTYQIYCASCHGAEGEGYMAGGSGPGIGLPGFLSVACDDYIFQTIKHGRIGTPMMPFMGAKGLASLTESEVGDIISFLRNK